MERTKYLQLSVLFFMEDDYIFFAEELHEITPRIISTSFGNVYSLTAGMPGQPLILVVHGSGPKNSADQYAYLLHEYLVRVSYLEKYYIVAIDCPGYGRSPGSKQAVKTFPLRLFQEILKALNYRTYFAMLGHSQGGAAIFNAVFEEPSITQFLVMDRPVCGNIQRFRGFSIPTLLIYDIQDDGHPIWQGKLLYKQLKNTELYTYRNSTHNYWVPDNIWEKMLVFFAKQFRLERKYCKQIGENRKTKSLTKQKSKKKSGNKKGGFSVDKAQQFKKKEKNEQKLVQIEENQKSQLFSVSSKGVKFQQEAEWFSDDSSQQFDAELVEYKKQKIQTNPFIANIRHRRQNQKIEQINYIQIERPEIKPQKKRQVLSKQSLLNSSKEIFIQKVQNKPKQISKQELLKDDNKCAICYQTLYRPITTNCNHNFCHKCVIQSLLVNDKCPLCRAKITKKTQNKDIHQQIIKEMTAQDIQRRQRDFQRIQTMMKSIIYIEIGNHSRQMQTKQSIFTKTKKKYIWELFVKQPKNFPIEQVGFNINMGDISSKPVRIRNAPFAFESRGTFSFACQITIKPKNKEYADVKDVYRINVQPGTHTKVIALRKKIYTR